MTEEKVVESHTTSSPDTKTPSFLSKFTTFMANDRTFLAYLRTGLPCLATGLTMVHFLYLIRGSSAYVYFGAIMLIVIGSALPIIGAWQYAAIDQAVEQGRPYPNRRILKIFFYIIGAICLLIGANFVIYAFDPAKIAQAFGH